MNSISCYQQGAWPLITLIT